EAVKVEGMEPHLHVPRVVPAYVAREVDVKPLSKRRKPSDAVGPIEEGRRAGDENVETGEAAAVEVIDQLAQGFQTLIAGVGTDALDRLHLVEDEQQPWPAALL